ncbi:RND transporter, partial [Salmonella enterica]
HNPSVVSAQAALRQAQENLNAAAGGQFPAVSGALGATRQKSSLAGIGIENSRAPSPIYTLYNASVSVSYTIDLFGAVRRQ